MRRPGPVLVLLGLSAPLAACALPEEVAPGRAAPDFAAVTLDGEPIRLRDLEGQAVLVNIWATWCLPCRREMPTLEAVWQGLGDRGLRVVAVSTDGAGADAEIRAFVEELDLSFDVVHDRDGRIARRYRTRGVPETFLIAPDGTLRRHWLGRIDARAPGVYNAILDALPAARVSAGAAVPASPVRRD
jgi:peroxiredoxin